VIGRHPIFREFGHIRESAGTVRHMGARLPGRAPRSTVAVGLGLALPGTLAAALLLGGTPAAAHPARVGRAQPAGSSPAGRSGSRRPLAGTVVGIDPGHNGGNFSHPAQIDKRVWNGREYEACDTTGTETDGGYTEARYNWNVANYLAADLREEGAKVVLTRRRNTGVGPCVNKRAWIINWAHANVAIDIQADGGPPSGRGFTVLEPVADGPNNKVIRPSDRFALNVRWAFRAIAGMPESDYYGSHGLIKRDDLAGLNLTTVPKVLIECGNMRNATDARLLVTARFQRKAARALAEAITWFLTHR
jgi:N-acetylmuramoyl-L-alanine amidase